MSEMRFDSWGLGYLRSGDSLIVCYPWKRDGVMVPAGGMRFPFDHRPELERCPDGERAVLWRSMLDGAA